MFNMKHVSCILNSVALPEVVYFIKCMSGLGPKLCGEGFVSVVALQFSVVASTAMQVVSSSNYCVVSWSLSK